MKGTHTLTKTDQENWIIVHTDEGPNDGPCELDALGPNLDTFVAGLAPGDYDITGIRDGRPVIGDVTISVGDDASGVDAGPREMIGNVPLIGGPLDGMKVDVVAPTADFQLLTMADAGGNLTSDELYFARIIDGEVWGVYAEMMQDYVRSDEVHLTDPTDAMQRRMRDQAGVPEGDRFRALVPLCAKGTHDWSPWQRTPRGNKTRVCRKCLSSQSSLLS